MYRAGSLVFLNNRHYDPTTGTFISVDPLVSKTMQPYIYGAANPARYSDPNGLEPRPIHCRKNCGDPGPDPYHSSCGGYGGCPFGMSRDGTPLTRDEAAAIDRFVGPDKGPSLLPNAPARPTDPHGGQLWDYVYGGRSSDESFLEQLHGILDQAAPYVAGGALVVCIAASGGVCGVVTAAAAGYTLVNNTVACLDACEDWGDVGETVAKASIDVVLARLPAPNALTSAGSVNRYVARTGYTETFAYTVFRVRRIGASAAGSTGSYLWEVP